MADDEEVGKIFVLDTNVLLHNANSIFSFGNNLVIIPITDIEELDGHKSRNDEVGRNARQVARILDGLRAKGSLYEGVETDNGGLIRIEMNNKEVLGDKIPLGLDLSIADNRILAVAYNQNKEEEKKAKGKREVWVITKDINMRLKADAIGLKADDYNTDRVDIDSLYGGWQEVMVPSGVIDKFNQEGILSLTGEFFPNEFVHLIDQNDPKKKGVVRFDANHQSFVGLDKDYATAYELSSLNKEQRFALELLLNPRIELVTLVGQAGTGKTLMALAAGLQLVINSKRYERMLVTRPIIPVGKDLGFLPGTETEKLEPWMRPIYDNLEFLLSRESRKRGKKISIGSREDNGYSTSFGHKASQYIGNDKPIELEAITYIRGRSIPAQYIIVDEAQNLTPHEIKTIISRAGEGTKVILTGDPAQIDNPYLDSESNGLTYVVERLKHRATVGHITLTKTERSALASIAAEDL